MNGEGLYKLWAQANADQGCDVEAWDDLEQDVVDVWEDTAIAVLVDLRPDLRP